VHRQIPGFLAAVFSAVIGGWILSSTASVPHVVVVVVALGCGVLIFGAMRLAPRWCDWRRARLVAAIGPDLMAAMKAEIVDSLPPASKEPASERERLGTLYQEGRVLLARLAGQGTRNANVPVDIFTDIASWEARAIDLVRDPELNLKLRAAPYTDPFAATTGDAYKTLYYQVDNLEYFIRDHY
jgi:hypothetical protein